MFDDFLAVLTGKDYVAVEACANAFWFYDQVIGLVSDCYVVNPGKFAESSKTRKKTDKVDSKKLVKKLRYRVLCDGDEDDLPTVYVPTDEVRELRGLFSTYKMLVKQCTMMRNRIHSLVVQHGKYLGKTNIAHPLIREQIRKLELPKTTVYQIGVMYREIDFLMQQTQEVKETILERGQVFEHEIDRLVSIKGVSVFVAIALMSDIAEIERFEKAKNLCSYLRSAPKVRASNKSEKTGCVNRCSRKLSLKMLLQGLPHVYKSSEYLNSFYLRKKGSGKKAGKARIAVARKTFTHIYQMLKKDEYFRWMDPKNHEKKMKEYRAFLKRRRKKEPEIKKSA